jgi:hypothetical protein
MAETNSSSSMPPFSDVLKQLAFDSPDEITKKETGKKIAEKIYSDQTGQTNNLNFFAARAIRWTEIEKWSLGKQDMQQFLPYMNVADGNKAYVQIDMTPIMIGAQFVNTLVESIAENEEYACVSAIDDDSMAEKEQRQLDALFRMHEVETINDIQQQAGIQVEPANVYVPDNELSAKIYFELEDRLPKEIRFEKKLEGVLIENQYERVMKRRMLRDNIVFNLECTKIEKDEDYNYCIRKCIPRNVFYSFFMGDTGKTELGYIGECYNLKVRDLRKKYGVSPSNPKGLTEEEIYNLAKMSSQQTQVNFAHLWGQQYATFNNNTPWDEYSVYAIDFEIKVTVTDYYVSKIDSYGKENITPKKGIPKPTSEKATIKKKEKDKIYRGVYAPYAKEIIYWGLPDLVLHESLFTYSVNIPNNTGEYVPSLFERALEPLREYALTKLKRKQLIAKLSPATYRIDVESARNITNGTGDVLPWEEIVRIKDQTGVELWSSKGLNPLEREAPPFSAPTADPTINNIIELSGLLASIGGEIRSLLGVPAYRDGSDLPDRTPAKLAEGQNTSSFNVTNFIPNAHNQVMEETLYKICLLCWQDVVTDKKETTNDLINTKFKVSVKMKQTAYERQLLEQNIQVAMQTIDQSTGKPLISFKDAYTIRNIKNYKLAEMYLANKIEENEKKAIADSERLQAQNAQVQQQSAELAAKQAQKLQEDKIAAEKDVEEFKATKTKEVELLKGFMQVAAKDETGMLIKQFLPAIQQLVPNISLPLQQENKQMTENIQAQEIADQEAAIQEQQNIQQPQMQMA